jgi:hypothetical protein
MSRGLAGSLGWVAASERLSKTIERAQLTAYNLGAQETTVEHLFAAELEDLDAVYFLAQHGVPLAVAATLAPKAETPQTQVPRIAPPSYSPTKVLTEPHKDIPAATGMRRVMALASAIAERHGLEELHGGIVLEAILEDGRSEAAVGLKAKYLEIARQRRLAGPALPGVGHAGAAVVVLPPNAPAAPPPPPPPRRTLDDPLAQVRWLQSEVARELAQDRVFKFIRELDSFADQARAYISASAHDLRMQAYAELSANPIYRVHQELQDVEQACEALHNRVRGTALTVHDGQPAIFERFLGVISPEAAQALRTRVAARADERANLAAMKARMDAQAQAMVWPQLAGATGNGFANGFQTGQVLGRTMTYAPEGMHQSASPIPVQATEAVASQDESTMEAGRPMRKLARWPSFLRPSALRERARSRVSKVWVMAAAAGAGMASLRFLI